MNGIREALALKFVQLSQLRLIPHFPPFYPFHVLTTDLERICARTHAHQPRIPFPSGIRYALRTAHIVALDSRQPPQSRGGSLYHRGLARRA